MPAYTSAQRVRIVIVGAVVPLLIAGVGIAVMFSWSDLPDPIAIHWGQSDGPNGFGTVTELAFLVGLTVLFFAAIATLGCFTMRAGSTQSYVPRLLVAVSVWLSVFLTGGIVGTVALQRGLVDATSAPDPTLPLLVSCLIALPIGAAAWFLTPRAATIAVEPTDAPVLDLGTDERVLWQRSVGPNAAFVVVLVIAVLLLMGGVVLALLTGEPESVPLVVIPAIIVFATSTTLFWKVRVDAKAVTTRSSVGWPRFRYPLSEIVAARAVQLEPLREFGGWGIRVGGGGRLGIVLRSGEALEVERGNGRVFVVTVDDASTAAALINGLVRRAAVTG